MWVGIYDTLTLFCFCPNFIRFLDKIQPQSSLADLTQICMNLLLFIFLFNKFETCSNNIKQILKI